VLFLIIDLAMQGHFLFTFSSYRGQLTLLLLLRKRLSFNPSIGEAGFRVLVEFLKFPMFGYFGHLDYL
jgi:hypothetical protein